MDQRTQKMAEVLITYSVAVKPGDWVVIQSDFLGRPLAQACLEETVKAGGNPSLLYGTDDEVTDALIRHGNDDQLAFISPIRRESIETADVRIRVWAPENSRALTNVDSARMAIMQKAMEPMMTAMMRRSAAGEYRWSVCAYPTQSGAQDAGMSLRDFEDFIYGGCMVDRPDPVAAWREQEQQQQRLIDWLQGKKEIHITGPGTDLRVNLEGGIWINDGGHENFPGGEIFTAPNPTGAEGSIQFNFPGFYGGREVTGVRLKFESGKVVDASAAADEAFLLHMLDMDEGARRLGEFAFGTNPGIQKFTKSVLFDEKIGGTLHMALGAAYPESGGTNESSLHWDMVYNLRNGAEVTVDGELFSKNGEFVV